VTEFVGTNVLGDTIGMVIANVDPKLRAMMKLEKDFRSIGILGARTGAGPHIFAADEAVKATNSEILTIELPRDTKGGAGHGSRVRLSLTSAETLPSTPTGDLIGASASTEVAR